MKFFNTIVLLAVTGTVSFSQFAPPVGEVGTTAIANDSSAIINWANEVVSFDRGYEDITDPEGPLASYGTASEALGYAEGNSSNVVSLGDNGSITLGFQYPIKNEEGWDFTVFENSFSDSYLEFAHVEVSSDGDRFVRMPSVSNIQTETQTGAFGESNAEEVYNLAGKYRQGYGTPFDLDDIIDSADINLNAILYVRIIDVVGSVDPTFGSLDSEGNSINDPFTTAFESGGFDLDGVGVINEDNPFSTLIENDNDAFTVYPNPTNGMLYFSGVNPTDMITIFSLQGDLIGRISNRQSVCLTDYQLDAGMYLVTIVSEDNRTETLKVSYFH